MDGTYDLLGLGFGSHDENLEDSFRGLGFGGNWREIREAVNL